MLASARMAARAGWAGAEGPADGVICRVTPDGGG